MNYPGRYKLEISTTHGSKIWSFATGGSVFSSPALSGDGTALLVALHACGGLSDVALRLAASWGASCLICTCCFGKHRALSPAAEWDLPNGEEAKDVLCRMADCVDPSVSDEARRVVSCLRLQSLRRQMRPSSRVTRASIRTFPSDYSRQNVVLCAACE